MRGVAMNDVLVMPLGNVIFDASGMLDSAVMWLGTVSAHENVALRRGSSQHGRQRLASIDSNCVDAMSFFSPLMFVYLHAGLDQSRGVSSPQKIHVAAAARRRDSSEKYPRRGRGVAASRPRRRRVGSAVVPRRRCLETILGAV